MKRFALMVFFKLLLFRILLIFIASCPDLTYSLLSRWKNKRQKTHSDTKFRSIQNETLVHNHFMDLALEEARLAGDKGEVPIGALMVHRNRNGDFKILSRAHNLVETRHDASAHAEMLALQQAAKRQKNWRLLNTTLYSSLEPCPMCLAACQAFRVSSVVYGAPDMRLGAIETHIRLLDTPHPYHTIEAVVPRVKESESAELLRGFFRKRRKIKCTPKTKTWFSKVRKRFFSRWMD